jgi:hypothetical protein
MIEIFVGWGGGEGGATWAVRAEGGAFMAVCPSPGWWHEELP